MATSKDEDFAYITPEDQVFAQVVTMAQQEPDVPPNRFGTTKFVILDLIEHVFQEARLAMMPEKQWKTFNFTLEGMEELNKQICQDVYANAGRLRRPRRTMPADFEANVKSLEETFTAKTRGMLKRADAPMAGQILGQIWAKMVSADVLPGQDFQAAVMIDRLGAATGHPVYWQRINKTRLVEAQVSAMSNKSDQPLRLVMTEAVLSDDLYKFSQRVKNTPANLAPEQPNRRPAPAPVDGPRLTP